jgi:hypothetical protein
MATDSFFFLLLVDRLGPRKDAVIYRANFPD